MDIIRSDCEPPHIQELRACRDVGRGVWSLSLKANRMQNSGLGIPGIEAEVEADWGN